VRSILIFHLIQGARIFNRLKPELPLIEDLSPGRLRPKKQELEESTVKPIFFFNLFVEDDFFPNKPMFFLLCLVVNNLIIVSFAAKTFFYSFYLGQL